MGVIRLNGIHVHAFHGCMQEEAIIGGDYIVDLVLQTDFDQAALQDNLELTIDYVAVNRIVHDEMAIRSKLIEAVAHRIALGLKEAFPNLDQAEVSVTKLSPPMGGHVDSVSVTVSV